MSAVGRACLTQKTFIAPLSANSILHHARGLRDGDGDNGSDGGAAVKKTDVKVGDEEDSGCEVEEEEDRGRGQGSEYGKGAWRRWLFMTIISSPSLA